MDLTMLPLVFAQAQPAAPNASSLYTLALRRWCSGLTLSAPQVVPGAHGVWAFIAGLSALLVLAVLCQGPLLALKQVLDLVGHARIIRTAARAGLARRAGGHDRDRLYRCLVDGQSSVGISPRESSARARRRSQAGPCHAHQIARLGELATEQGVLAAVTPLRDVAGLADNLPLLIIAAIVVFRAAFDLPGWGNASPAFDLAPPRLPITVGGRQWRGAAPRSTRSTGLLPGWPAAPISPWETAWSSRPF